jgi:hypothetical protein
MKNFLQIAFIGEKNAISSLVKRGVMLCVVAVLAIAANAGTYKYLEFTSTSGTKTVFDVANLTIKVSGNDLQVTNSDGTVDLKLLDLASMQFSTTNTSTAVDNILNADAEIHVSTITGVSLGTYSSLVEACQSLNAGVYVISNGTQSQSIVIQ